MLLEARLQLAEYFEGRKRIFSIPLAAKGRAFQQKVWKALLDIPFGATESYGPSRRESAAPVPRAPW